MKIPKRILDLITEIEEIGSKLTLLESELYSWLDNSNIDTELFDSNKEICIDHDLDALFHSNNGTDLIEDLKKL